MMNQGLKFKDINGIMEYYCVYGNIKKIKLFEIILYLPKKSQKYKHELCASYYGNNTQLINYFYKKIQDENKFFEYLYIFACSNHKINIIKWLIQNNIITAQLLTKNVFIFGNNIKQYHHINDTYDNVKYNFMYDLYDEERKKNTKKTKLVKIIIEQIIKYVNTSDIKLNTFDTILRKMIFYTNNLLKYVKIMENLLLLEQHQNANIIECNQNRTPIPHTIIVESIIQTLNRNDLYSNKMCSIYFKKFIELGIFKIILNKEINKIILIKKFDRIMIQLIPFE
jgi:hypothetical protein